MKIKNALLTICVLLTWTLSYAQTSSNALVAASTSEEKSIEWISTIHNFGEIDYNIPVTATFEFTNTGSEPVAILKVKSSCGCTVADYSKEPVLPGKSATVSATYNAKRNGHFQKSITINTTDNKAHRLTLKGVVVQKTNPNQ